MAEGRRLAEEPFTAVRALVLVAAYTGLRWGELAGLRVKRVDLLHRRITVTEQLLEESEAKLAFEPTKTGAGLRTVTLPTVAAEALAEHLSTYAEPGPEGLVFSAEREPIRRSNFTRRVWIPATRAAGVGGSAFHDLRRTAATPGGGCRR